MSPPRSTPDPLECPRFSPAHASLICVNCAVTWVHAGCCNATPIVLYACPWTAQPSISTHLKTCSVSVQGNKTTNLHLDSYFARIVLYRDVEVWPAERLSTGAG